MPLRQQPHPESLARPPFSRRSFITDAGTPGSLSGNGAPSGPYAVGSVASATDAESMLSGIPYEQVAWLPLELPRRPPTCYLRTALSLQAEVADYAATIGSVRRTS